MLEVPWLVPSLISHPRNELLDPRSAIGAWVRSEGSGLRFIPYAIQCNPLLRAPRPVVYRGCDPARVVEGATPDDPDEPRKAGAGPWSVEDPNATIRTNPQPLRPAARGCDRRSKRQSFTASTEGISGYDYAKRAGAARDTLAIGAMTSINPER
jgi:hypothetical protein